MSDQLTFDFPFSPKFLIKDFIQDESNAEAFHWIMNWPNWPSGKLILYGACKCGKTHLADLWLKSVCGYKLSSDDFLAPVRDVFEKNSNFLIDDLVGLMRECESKSFGERNQIKAEIENWLFDFLNIVTEKNVTLLITARNLDFEKNIRLKDLSSRLAAINTSKIDSPSDDLLKKIILKIAADLCVAMKEEIASYIVNHINRDIESIEMLMHRLNEISLKEKREITINLLKQIIQ